MMVNLLVALSLPAAAEPGPAGSGAPLAVPAEAPPPAKVVVPAAGALPTVDELLAMPDHAARAAALKPAASGPDYAASVRAGAALAVLAELEADGRTDAALVRGFLEAALSDDGNLRDKAVALAKEGGLPPAPSAPAVVHVPVPTPAALAPAPPSLDLLRSYRDQRLYKGTRQVMMTTLTATQYGSYASVRSADNWTVYQNERALTPKDFARTVGDEAGLARMRKTEQTVAGVTVGGLLAGVGGLAGGGALLGDDSYGNDTAGVVLMMGPGVLGLSTAFAVPYVFSLTRNWVASSYDPEEADEWIRRHNDELRGELGLTEQDVLMMETLGD